MFQLYSVSNSVSRLSLLQVTYTFRLCHRILLSLWIRIKLKTVFFVPSKILLLDSCPFKCDFNSWSANFWCSWFWSSNCSMFQNLLIQKSHYLLRSDVKVINVWNSSSCVLPKRFVIGKSQDHLFISFWFLAFYASSWEDSLSLPFKICDSAEFTPTDTIDSLFMLSARTV